jgi:hypothetical protein
MKMQYLAEVQAHVAGIPCLIGVMTYVKVKPWGGSSRSCDNPDDYYGYEEIEYDVLDRKGYLANWLSKKITDDDKIRIDELIYNHFHD